MAKRQKLPHQEILNFLEVISSSKIEYVIIGGAALALHGIPRSTLDIDLIIPSKTKSITKIFKVAKSTNLYCKQPNILALINAPILLVGQWITLENKNKVQLIDIYLEDETEFKKLRKNAITRKSGKTRLYVASLKDLEQMKKQTNRPIDIADLTLIKELKKAKRRSKNNR